MTSRRDFIRTSSLYTAGFLGLRELALRPLGAAEIEAGAAGFGPLLDDPEGLLRLPQGFRYSVFSSTGEEMADGLLVPGKHDGMAAFAGPNGRTILVRNHEMESRWAAESPFGPDQARIGRIAGSKIYDRGNGIAPNLGGTSTLVFDTRTQTLETHFLSLVGTVRNCAGGETPWGSWVTCEEINARPEPNAEQPHGFNFEVPARATGLVDPVPLKAMGRFRHEAIAVDPRSGAVYETEDIENGLLYRFLPKEKGRLAAGGRLQALVMEGWKRANTSNWVEQSFPVGTPQRVTWIDLEDVEENVAEDLRLRGAAAGAAIFARGEGAWYGNDSVYFAMTTGGRAKLGQLFRYRPSPYEGTARESEQPGTLELFSEPNNSELVRNCDNVTVAPWGDLILCEDTSAACRVIGVTPQGEYYVLAANTQRGRELAGACFSPDGTTLFVNIQNPGYTVAITGPWASRHRTS